jgi:hypothetical protein
MRTKKKILIIGHKRHGKGTLSSLIQNMYGFSSKSSSEAALDIFLFDVLAPKYGYKTKEEAFEDRVNHRGEWYQLIRNYNAEDDTRLAREIMSMNDIYDGLRDISELKKCRAENVFDLVIGVFNPNLPLEDSSSFNLDLFRDSDLIIPNLGTSLTDLKEKLIKIEPILFK